MRTKFKSAVDISNLVDSKDKIVELRKKLETDLEKFGIDYTTAISNISDETADKDQEAIVRLVSLARGNGLYVNINTLDNEDIISVSLPNGSVGQLQSGHH